MRISDWSSDVCSSDLIRANRRRNLIRCFLYVPLMFFSFSYRLPSRLAGESITSRDKDSSMTNMALFPEQPARADPARLISPAFEPIGRPSCDFARDAQSPIAPLRSLLSADHPDNH